MKKILTGILIVMVLALSACSAAPTAAPAATNAPAAATVAATTAAVASSASALNNSYTDAVSVEEQLLVGTIALDGTSNQVTKDQANTLITLYTSLQSLSQMGGPGGNAGGAAPQGTPDANATQPAQTNDNQTQIDALVQQIEAAMTADQINAIAAMQITQTSEASILQNKGITLTMGNGQQGGDQSAQGGNSSAQGNGPQGTPPAANGTPDANQQANGQGQPGGNGQGNGQMDPGGNRVQPGLVNAVLQYLANIAGVTLPSATQPAS